VTISTAVAVAGSLAADIGCALADPRVTLGRREAPRSHGVLAAAVSRRRC
jgi:hypothetical protein